MLWVVSVSIWLFDGVLSLSVGLYSLNCAIYAIQGLAFVMIWLSMLARMGRGAIEYRSLYSFGDISSP